MKKDLNNILLEAIHRGINFALDDFDDSEDLVGQQTQTIKDKNYTKDYLQWQELIKYINDVNIEKVNDNTIRRLVYLSKKYGFKYTILNGNKEILIGIINWVCKIDLHADLNWIDVSQVKDMSYLFSHYNNGDLRLKFDGNISEWDTSNVEDMTAMFCYSEFNGNISNWNVSKVKCMRSMFSNAKYFNQPLNDWDVRNVENMSYMFYHASNFNQPLNKWQPINVQTNNCMFENSPFHQDISMWRFEHLLNSEDIFLNCKNNGRNFPEEYIPRQMKSYWPDEFMGINK